MEQFPQSAVHLFRFSTRGESRAPNPVRVWSGPPLRSSPVLLRPPPRRGRARPDRRVRTYCTAASRSPKVTIAGGLTGPGPDGVFGKNAAGESDPRGHPGGRRGEHRHDRRATPGELRSAGRWVLCFFPGERRRHLGASPPVSADYRDEPSIEVDERAGRRRVDGRRRRVQPRYAGTVADLSRDPRSVLSDNVTACQGVTVGADGCYGTGEHAFVGADFPYLAANVVWADGPASSKAPTGTKYRYVIAARRSAARPRWRPGTGNPLRRRRARRSRGTRPRRRSPPGRRSRCPDN